MSKKKPARQVPVQVAPARKPVMQGEVFFTLITEAREMGAELMARRWFDQEASTFLKEKGLTAEFSAWREARKTPPKV